MKFHLKYPVIIFFITCLFVSGCRYSSEELTKVENKLSARYNEKIEQLAKEIEKLMKEIEILSKERDELKNSLDDEIKQSSFLKSELNTVKEKLKEKEKKIAQKDDTQPIKPMFIRGKIRSIQISDSSIIVSLGKKDNITVDSEFEVYRQGKMLGKIKIDSIETNWSVAYSVKVSDFNLFKIGDDILLSVTE